MKNILSISLFALLSTQATFAAPVAASPDTKTPSVPAQEQSQSPSENSPPTIASPPAASIVTPAPADESGNQVHHYTFVEPPPLFDPPESRPEPLFGIPAAAQQPIQPLRPPPMSDARTEKLPKFTGAKVHPEHTPYPPERHYRNCHWLINTLQITGSLLALLVLAYGVVFFGEKLVCLCVRTVRSRRRSASRGRGLVRSAEEGLLSGNEKALKGVAREKSPLPKSRSRSAESAPSTTGGFGDSVRRARSSTVSSVVEGAQVVVESASKAVAAVTAAATSLVKD